MSCWAFFLDFMKRLLSKIRTKSGPICPKRPDPDQSPEIWTNVEALFMDECDRLQSTVIDYDTTKYITEHLYRFCITARD